MVAHPRATKAAARRLSDQERANVWGVLHHDLRRESSFDDYASGMAYLDRLGLTPEDARRLLEAQG